jgi:hypothetical protein
MVVTSCIAPIGSNSQTIPMPINPAGYAFAIWFVIWLFQVRSPSLQRPLLSAWLTPASLIAVRWCARAREGNCGCVRTDAGAQRRQAQRDRSAGRLRAARLGDAVRVGRARVPPEGTLVHYSARTAAPLCFM